MMFGGSPISVAVPPMLLAKDLDDHERDRRDPQQVGEQQSDRDDEQDRGEVVEEGREQAGHHREQEHEPGGLPTRELGHTEREVREDAGRAP